MKYKALKILSFLTFFFTSFNVIYSHAVDGEPYTTISELEPILANVFNIFVASAAAVMIAMVAYGLWKSSMAVGDPRGLEGAKQVWTYALFGFIVIVLFFVLFMITARLFGISSLGSPQSILGKVFEAINDLVSIPTVTN